VLSQEGAASESRKHLDNIFGNPAVQAACEELERREHPLAHVSPDAVMALWHQYDYSFEVWKCHCYGQHTVGRPSSSPKFSLVCSAA
jgi:hypothetical protein